MASSVVPPATPPKKSHTKHPTPVHHFVPAAPMGTKKPLDSLKPPQQKRSLPIETNGERKIKQKKETFVRENGEKKINDNGGGKKKTEAFG